MNDWPRLVERRLGALSSNPAAHREAISELACHLEDFYDELRNNGLKEPDAVERALKELNEGHHLGRRIRSAREGDMNERTRQFWLPGLASICAASFFLLIFARVSYMPRMLVVRSGAALMMYPAWLTVQPLLGAIGAYFSRRAGGNRITRVFAALSPSIALMVLVCIGVIVQAVMAFTGKPSDIGSMGTIMFARAIFFAVAVPSAALLLGALPFLKNFETTA
jgi:hypothetical protein